MKAISSSAPASLTDRPRAVNSVVTLVGGRKLAVLQGAGVIHNRLEAAWEAPAAFAAVALEGGVAAHVNPSLVALIEPVDRSESHAPARPANARVFFRDGTWVDVVQGAGVVSKRIRSAGASGGLFAPLRSASGATLYLNRLAITHIAATTG